jgi:hypothetical protein
MNLHTRNFFLLFFSVSALTGAAMPARAQDDLIKSLQQQQQQDQQQEAVTEVPAAEVAPPVSIPPPAEENMPRQMDDFPVVKLRSLDKVTARTVTFEGSVGSTVKFGPLYIKIQSCREAPPIEQPESAAFLQVWEVTPQEEARWIFSGWMFASSPGLSSMDHPIYDVWVLDCLEKKASEKKQAPEDEIKQGEGEIKAGEAPVAPGATMEEPIPEEDVGN